MFCIIWTTQPLMGSLGLRVDWTSIWVCCLLRTRNFQEVSWVSWLRTRKGGREGGREGKSVGECVTPNVGASKNTNVPPSLPPSLPASLPSSFKSFYLLHARHSSSVACSRAPHSYTWPRPSSAFGRSPPAARTKIPDRSTVRAYQKTDR